MQALYLNAITNPTLMESLLSISLHEMLNIRREYEVVPFSYPGWPTADYISKISNNISQAMYDEGLSLAKKKFKDFNPEKTKLTSEMFEQIWMKASQAITQEIWSGFEAEPMNKIPGLNESLEEGAIIPTTRGDQGISHAREKIKKKAKQIDFRDEFLRKFRGKYFTYMKEHYGLFSEYDKEVAQGFKMK